MLLSSSVLSVFGCTAVYKIFAEDKWEADYIYGEEFESRCIALFFIAANIMDLVIGFIRYPEYLDPLTTIFHHIFYISFMAILLAMSYTRGFLLCFLLEIPTVVLALGSVWPSLRSDLLFGVTFVPTRLVFNAYLAFKLGMMHPEGYVWRVCMCVLGLHIYWFYNWSKTYGVALLKSFF
jgi:hypothetical protein